MLAKVARACSCIPPLLWHYLNRAHSFSDRGFTLPVPRRFGASTAALVETMSSNVMPVSLSKMTETAPFLPLLRVRPVLGDLLRGAPHRAAVADVEAQPCLRSASFTSRVLVLASGDLSSMAHLGALAPAAASSLFFVGGEGIPLAPPRCPP